MSKPGLARTSHAQVVADVSRHHSGCDMNAPTDVGGYTLSANRARHKIFGLGQEIVEQLRRCERSAHDSSIKPDHSTVTV
jgi:hypothetical protein